MTIAGELVNILGFKLEGQENLAKFNAGMDGAENKATRFNTKVKALATAAGLTTAGAIALGTAAVKNFAGFEREMNRIGITADASVEQTTKAADQVQRLSKQFAMPIQDAVGGLDTLVASGMSLEEAMAFLPSVLATAQASGSAVNDVANTALKTASALGLEAGEMQKAFDIMVIGGKAGQFEMKDMAGAIPTLANSFAQLGYKGEDGLKRLIAILQTLREDTGTAGQAATQAQNIFGKMFSAETEKNFREFGVDIRKEVDTAVKAGEGAVEAYVRISRRVMQENPTAKLVDLFADTEFQLGMQSLMTSGESYQKFLDSVSGAKVEGTVFEDLNRVLGDTQSSIDRLSNSWDQFMKSLGSAAAEPVGGTLDALTGDLDRGSAIRRALKAQGKSYWQRETEMFFSNPYGDEMDRLAREGGYVPTDDNAAREAAEYTPEAYKVLGRRPNRPVSKTPDSAYSKDQIPTEPPSWFQKFMYGAAAEPGFNFRESMGVEVKAGGDGSSGDQTGVYAEIAGKLENMNSTLAKMTSGAAAEAVITDARQDNRNQSVTVGDVIVQGVQNVTPAVGAAVGQAVGRGAVNAASARDSTRLYNE